ncbi:MAG: hypothetical protein Q7J16_00190 [Candidatus Cloacimonadales bacterium]|nr:hypothetical protein [Candidatus Cloacimonadales bacterium]
MSKNVNTNAKLIDGPVGKTLINTIKTSEVSVWFFLKDKLRKFNWIG